MTHPLGAPATTFHGALFADCGAPWRVVARWDHGRRRDPSRVGVKVLCLSGPAVALLRVVARRGELFGGVVLCGAGLYLERDRAREGQSRPLSLQRWRGGGPPFFSRGISWPLILAEPDMGADTATVDHDKERTRDLDCTQTLCFEHKGDLDPHLPSHTFVTLLRSFHRNMFPSSILEKPFG